MTGTPSHIALVNRSRGLVPDGQLAAIVEAYRQELPEFCAAWGIPVPGLALYDSRHTQVPEEEACIFVVESGGDPDTFGAHTKFGKFVWGYADAALAMAREEPISRVIGHEIFEMIVDPGLDIWVDVGGGERVAVEVSDSPQRFGVQRMASFFGHSAVVDVADWCYPSFFKPGNVGPYDRMGVIKAPLEIAAGGYLVRRTAGAAFVQGAGGITNHGRTIRRLSQAF